MRTHPMVSAVLVVIVGTIATWVHYVGDWIRSYDKTNRYE